MQLPFYFIVFYFFAGTTLKPKLVPLTMRNLCTAAVCIASTLQLAADDVCLNVMPLYHLHGLMINVLVPLVTGSRTVCANGWSSGARFFALAGQLGVTWYSAVPTIHLAVVQHAEQSLMRNGEYPQ